MQIEGQTDTRRELDTFKVACLGPANENEALISLQGAPSWGTELKLFRDTFYDRHLETS